MVYESETRDIAVVGGVLVGINLVLVVMLETSRVNLLATMKLPMQQLSETYCRAEQIYTTRRTSSLMPQRKPPNIIQKSCRSFAPC